ncbi:MAG: sugar phosphate isomerase/epimerase family protein [archaeon]
MKLGISYVIAIKKSDFLMDKELGMYYLSGLEKLMIIKKKYELDCAEILIEPPINSKFLSDNKDTIKKILEDNVITCHLPMSEVNMSAMDKSIRAYSIQELKDLIVFCESVNINTVVLHPGQFNDVHVLLKDYFFKYFKETALDLVSFSKKHKIKLCFENLPKGNNFFTKIEDMKILADLGANICFDTGHAITNNIDPCEFIKKIKISHIHMQSNRLGDFDRHLPLGSGDLDYRQVIRLLKEINYDNYIIFEMFNEKDLVQSLEAFRDAN